MITKLNVASIYVLDKEEALDFYVNKLGLEKGNDVRQARRLRPSPPAGLCPAAGSGCGCRTGHEDPCRCRRSARSAPG